MINPPLIFSLDTSSAFTVFGLARGNDMIAEERFRAPLQMRDHLPLQISQFISEHEAAQGSIEAIAWACGPGSFTGLRVSLALAKGIAFARGIPIWPVLSLKVLAANARGFDGTIAAIIPARKGECYLGLFDGEELLPLHEPICVDYAELEAQVPQDAVLLGPAISELPSEIREELKSPLARAKEHYHQPSVYHLADLAREQWLDKEPPNLDTLAPFYLKDFPA
jgi:tRNA threonylcarbamoyladenosine biosynthesis protein TsaB